MAAAAATAPLGGGGASPKIVRRRLTAKQTEELADHQGSTAVVAKGTFDGQDVIIKAVNASHVKGVTDAGRRTLQMEGQVVYGLRHENIVAVSDYGAQGTVWSYAMEVLAVSLGDLWRYVATQGLRLSSQFMREIGRDMLSALSYLHNLGIAHRDVKRDNIMFRIGRKKSNYGLQAVLIDFNTMQFRRDKFTIAGTPVIRAPELQARDPAQLNKDVLAVMTDPNSPEWLGNRCDIWSLGVCLFELATGKLWLKDVEREADIPDAIARVDVAGMCAEAKVDPELSRIICAMLERDLRKRPSADALLQDRYFNSGKELESASATIFDGPLSRHEINYDDAMMHPLWFYRTMFRNDYGPVRWELAKVLMHAYRARRGLVPIPSDHLEFIRLHVTGANGEMTLTKFLASNRVVSQWYRDAPSTPRTLVETYERIARCPICYSEAGSVEIVRKKGVQEITLKIDARKYPVDQSEEGIIFTFENHEHRIARMSDVFDAIKPTPEKKKR